MSAILEFYRGDGKDAQGRTFTETLSWSDEKWESTHDFIQWVFPTAEPSNFNADAPLLTDSDMEEFRNDSFMQNRMRLALGRFLVFLGLKVDENGFVVMLADSVATSDTIWKHPNHNWLRITRVLTSLRLVGLEKEAKCSSRAFRPFDLADMCQSEHLDIGRARWA